MKAVKASGAATLPCPTLYNAVPLLKRSSVGEVGKLYSGIGTSVQAIGISLIILIKSSRQQLALHHSH